MPLEWEYVDDADFKDEKKYLEDPLPVAKQVFEEWNLYINEEKIECTRFYLAKTR